MWRLFCGGKTMKKMIEWCDILPPINGCGLLDLEELHQFSLSTVKPPYHYSYPFGFRDTFDFVNPSNHMTDNLSAGLIQIIKNNNNINLLVRSNPTHKWMWGFPLTG